MRVLVFILVLLWLQKHSVKKCYHKNCRLLTTTLAQSIESKGGTRRHMVDLKTEKNRVVLAIDRRDQQHLIRADKRSVVESVSNTGRPTGRNNKISFFSQAATTQHSNGIISKKERQNNSINRKFRHKEQLFEKNDSRKRSFENENWVRNVTVSTRKLLLEKNRRAKKEKRFLSNLKSSLKKHLKNRHGSWAVSRKEAEKLFQKYNQCITDRLDLLQADEFPIKAFMAVEGEKIMMECKVCYRPDFDAASQKAVWQVLGHEATDTHAVTPNEKIKILKDNTLVIKDIDVDDAGQYYCVEHRDYMAIYQLDVFLTDKRRHVRVGIDEPRAEEFLLDRNLRVYTTWAPWSECNTCGRPGTRIRVGQCTVKKIYVDLPVFPRDYPLMVLYPEGIPCHSTALPSHMRRLHQIGERHSETIILPCMEPCPTAPPTRVVTDKNGDVLEILEPGFYSVKEKPTLPPIVKRKVFYEPEKSHLILRCPGDLDRSLVHWARGQRTVDPAHVKRQTQGRVWLDSSVMLHFDPLLLSDTAVYK
ncbi:hypothetical protein RRG08_017956 [Elysia crispata]|uniref:Ig-like domain-containing protein n=1 Tax=Elysia crispata TaxID=231223 RepID=A0AAE0ZEU7_9GAST|nr:hypothetical protein RRG08_017956 [Elysia crispata]